MSTKKRVKSSLSPLILILVFILFILTSMPLSSATLFYDDFERATLGSDWNVSVASGGEYGINTDTRQSGTRSLFTKSGIVEADTKALDSSSYSNLSISMWIRRGSDVFSEDPDSNEDLIIQYLNNSNSWINITTFAGSGTTGDIYQLTRNLNNDALHNNFKIRINQIAGNTGDWDYWHVDDVNISDATVTDSIFFDSSTNERDFTLYRQDNVSGDMKIIGNSVKLRNVSGVGVCAPDGTNNNNITAMYADKDTDNTTYNSTSANLVLPKNVKSTDILYAILYWQGRTNNSDGDVLNGTSAKIKPYGENSYTTINTIANKFNWRNSDYQGASDVTALIKNSIDDENQTVVETTGYDQPLWVADIYAPDNSNGFGAWSLVIAYEDEAAKFRNISTYDGYEQVYNETVSTTLSGFLTPTNGVVDSKFLLFAGEGDITLTDSVSLTDKNGDDVSLGNNIFKSSEDIDGTNVTNRNPSCQNTIGVDIRTFSIGSAGTTAHIIGNSQKETTIKLTSTGDEYFPGVFAFSTELYKPRVCYYIDTIKDDDNNTVFTDKSFVEGQEIEKDKNYHFDFWISNMKKEITDTSIEEAKLLKVNLIMNDFIYKTNSTYIDNDLLDINGTFINIHDPINDGDIGEFYIDDNKSSWRLGINADATNGGTIGVATNFNDNSKKSFIKLEGEFSLDENATTVNLLNHFEFRAFFETDSMKITSTDGEKIVQCVDLDTEANVKAPTGVFNVVNNNFTGSTDPEDQTDPLNALYTQVVNKPFVVKVLALEDDKTTLKNYTGDLNVTIIETPAYVENDDVTNKALCQNAIIGSSFGFTPVSFSSSSSEDRSFTYNKASKDLSFGIIYDDGGTPDYVCSRDSFAVRPDKFTLTAPSGEDIELLTAAKNYDLSLVAKQYGNSTPSNNYTVSNANSKLNIIKTLYEGNDTPNPLLKGTLNFSGTDFNITNGLAGNMVEIKFTDIGKVNIQLKDKEWAKVDIDNSDTVEDCSDTGAYVCGDINATFIPNRFNLTAVTQHNHNNSNFTYLSNDLNMSAHVSMTITALNFENNPTENFTTNSWENPVNVNIDINTTGTPTLNKNDINSTSNIGFVSGVKTIVWNESNNSKNLMFNFDRNTTIPHQPFKVLSNEVNITTISRFTAPTSGAIKDINSSIVPDQNTTFYYGRVHAPDQRFDDDNGVAEVYYEIYCDDCNKTDMNIDGNESIDSINWFTNTLHVNSDGNISRYKSSSDVKFGTTNHDTANNTQDNIANITNGKEPITLVAPSTPYKDKIDMTSNSWLISNPTDFMVEFYGTGNWAGQGIQGKTIDLNISKRQNKRLDW